MLVLHGSNFAATTDGVGVGEPPIAPIGSPIAVGFVGVGFGAATLIATPLFQTSFVPDLMHVNFLPDAVAVDPALVHLAPAFTAAKEGAVIKDKQSSSAIRILLRVITKRYQGAGKN
jgi:hypothetical protein